MARLITELTPASALTGAELAWVEQGGLARKATTQEIADLAPGGTATALSTGTRAATTYGITSDGGADDVILLEATTTLAGLLGSAKWNEIVANTAKLTNVPTALSVGTVGVNTVGITSDGGADDVIIPAATVSTAGLLTTAKWGEIVANTAKVTNATHTGQVTGSVALTIAAGVVTNAMQATMAANTVKANATAGTASPTNLAVGTNTVLGRVAGNIVAATLVAGQIASNAVTTVKILDANVTLPKMANIATASFIGRTTAATGVPEVLTATQATALLNNFTSTLKGLAPLSGGGTTTYLRADATWAPITSNINEKTTSYTLALTDSGQTIRFTGATASKVCTIDAAGTVNFPVGTMIGVTNDGSVVMTLAITTDTMTWGKDNTTGTRTLAPGADCVIQKVSTTSGSMWKVNGSALLT